MYMKRIFVISLSILLFLCGCQTEDTEVINSFYKDIISLSENQTIYDLDEIGECSSNIIGISEKTLERSEHFQKEKYNNLYYNKVDSKVSSNEKFFKVASEIDETYQYVWISHDHTIFNEQALNYIMKSLEKNRILFTLENNVKILIAL